MAKKSPAAPARTEIPAQFQLEPDTRVWIATALQPPKLQVRGIDIRQARSRLASALQAQLGKPVVVVPKFSMPKELQEDFDQYTEARERLEETKAFMDAQIVPLANRLLIEARLQQGQVAEMLGVSSAWLGILLKKDGTSGEVTKPRARRTE